jgi:flavodoxin
MKKAIVVYYSYEGTTKRIAEAIADSLGADLLEIKPIGEMQAKGFGKYLKGGYEVMQKKAPELMPMDKNIDDYDLVFLGTPVWASSYTPPIKTLLEGGYITNKEVAFFFCYNGGPGKALQKAKEAIEKNNTLIGEKGFVNPGKNMDYCIVEALEWAGKVAK